MHIWIIKNTHNLVPQNLYSLSISLWLLKFKIFYLIVWICSIWSFYLQWLNLASIHQEFEHNSPTNLAHSNLQFDYVEGYGWYLVQSLFSFVLCYIHQEKMYNTKHKFCPTSFTWKWNEVRAKYVSLLRWKLNKVPNDGSH